jgi:GDPmannose 4,6-dehydratase
MAFNEVDINIEWHGIGVNEKGVDIKTGAVLIEVDERYFRPAEVEILLGDPLKAEIELGWKRKISFQELVSGMVKYDLENDNFGGIE